jgi:hypothetical protein
MIRGGTRGGTDERMIRGNDTLKPGEILNSRYHELQFQDILQNF